MAKSHGKGAVLYLGAATAVPVAETSNISINLGADMADATAHGNAFRQYIPGINDFGMSVTKFYDNAYWVMWDAAIATTPLKMYFYPSRADNASFFCGVVYVSADSLESPVDDMNAESWNIVPASAVTVAHA